MPYSVLIVDDHPLILGGFSALVGSRAEFSIVALSADGEHALELLRERRPDVAILDVNLPKLSGLQVLQAIIDEALPTRCILISASFDRASLDAALRCGASGILRKDAEPQEILDCLLQVAEGGTNFPLSQTPDQFGALTAREQEIVSHAVRGLSNKGIAQRLSLSEGTVKIHIYNVFRKLGVRNRTELANLYYKGGRII